MKNDLIKIIDQFGSILTKHEYNQYIPKLRDFLVKYIIENKSHVSSVEELFKYEFTKVDIILCTEYYIINNDNVKSKSAIDDFLIAVNRIFDEIINNRYPNQNLITIRPFTNLNKDVENGLLNKGIILEERKANPPINENHYNFILEYMKNDKKSKKLKTQQVYIIFKLLLLYGFSFDRIINLYKENYNSETRTLEIVYNMNPKRSFILELPYSLNNEISNYTNSLNNKNYSDNHMFITRTGNPITHAFLNEYITDIKQAYFSINKLEINTENPFTPTGFAKYAVINMILDGVNQSVISDLTGFMQDMYSDCQYIVNEKKLSNRNRYINQMIRGISTYDDI